MRSLDHRLRVGQVMYFCTICLREIKFDQEYQERGGGRVHAKCAVTEKEPRQAMSNPEAISGRALDVAVARALGC